MTTFTTQDPVSFLCVPSETLTGGRGPSQLGSLGQKWLLCMLFLQVESVLPSSPAPACSVSVGCNLNTDQMTESGLSNIFSMAYTSVLLGTHFSFFPPHQNIDAPQRWSRLCFYCQILICDVYYILILSAITYMVLTIHQTLY